MMAGDAPGVKVCGIQRVEDAMLAAALGASAIGFIFWPGSPRFIDPARARAIADALPGDVLRVGVFVDQAPEYVRHVADRVLLGAAQLHGAESADAYTDLGLRLIKAIAVTDPFDGSAIDAVPDEVTVLLDAHDPVRRGGTGRTIDWSIAAAMAARRRTILSGGLNAANVSEAVERVRPYMIDVSSGVESAPGIKDAVRLRAFFDALTHRGNDQTNQDDD
jgi:phosphoribosylanthranilate isomerase